MKGIFLWALILITALNGFSQAREKQTINSGWQFVLNDEEAVPGEAISWKNINLPHTWNNLDIIDETPGYHRGIGWYKRELTLPESYRGKHLELFFEGACNKADVFINGQKAGEHIGGFTGFTIDISSYAKFGQPNTILVRVDNRPYLSEIVPPYSGDFNIMGGIYRDVWLVALNPAHLNDVFFQTPSVSEQSASFSIRATGKLNGVIQYQIKDGETVVRSGSKKITASQDAISFSDKLQNPKLWSPEDPHLYQLQVQLLGNKQELLDEVSIPVGFRWFGISAKKEFMLNGKPYKLNGASRHQDYYRMGNALTDARHENDIEMMKAMGCNFIRIAHYPQDPAIYNACDRLGLIAWSEIPVVDRIPANDTFQLNSAKMLKEMIGQNFNHPAVAIWGFQNEVRNLDQYSLKNARMLDSIARALDPQRLTAMAFESNLDNAYFKNPLSKEMLGIAMINGYNVYQGWYRGKHKDIGPFLDSLYSFRPDRPILLTEYGAGSSINIHTYQTIQFDFSEEYQVEFQQSYLEAGNRRPWMMGYSIWNFIDFQRDGREDVQPNINNKGMVTTDREPKDVYYYYKSQWSREPFVYIAGKHWSRRIAFTASNSSINIPIKVLSNQKQLSLYKDGKLIGSSNSDNGVFEWKVDVSAGKNQFICQTADGRYSDRLELEYQFADTTTFSTKFPFEKMNFNTGQSRTYFTDPATKEQWVPDKAYTRGTWGYVGSSPYNTWPNNTNWNGIREGINKPITNTDNEPLFQTFVEGLSAWKADVPAGKYRITVLLCEPFTEGQRKKEERIFDISLNGMIWVQGLNIDKQYGVQRAVILDKEVLVKDKQGITIDFKSVSGKTILNGVAIERL